VGPRAGLDAVAKRKIQSLPLPGIEPPNPDRLAFSLVSILNLYSSPSVARILTSRSLQWDGHEASRLLV
jgi:hypothetical protein